MAAQNEPGFLKRNIILLIVSACVLLLIGNYVFFVIPANKHRIDSQYYETLTHLRENMEKVNADLAKNVETESSDNNTANNFCKNIEYPVVIKIKPDSIGFYKNAKNRRLQDTLLIIKNRGYNDAYKKIFMCSKVTCVALADVAAKQIYYQVGKREPNAQLIFNYKSTSDFYCVQDSALNNLKYYVYQFKPASFDAKVMLILAINGNQYNSGAMTIDVSQTLFAVLLLLLFALMLPLLKSVIAKRYEGLDIMDVVFSTSAIGSMSVIAIAIVMSSVMNYYFSTNDEAQVIKVSSVMAGNFEKELNDFGKTLTLLDSVVKPGNNIASILSEQPLDSQTCLPALFSKRIFRFFRINEAGREIKNYFYHNALDTIYSRNKFSDRNYFKYQLANSEQAPLYYEPLISWTDRSFRISISKKTNPNNNAGKSDNCTRPFLSVLTYWPLSNSFFCLPKDFTFAVIDQNGIVQMHSDSTRNLMEDFSLQVGSPVWLKKEMVIPQRDTIVHEVLYHDEKSLVRLTPLNIKGNGNPLYLVVLKSRYFAEDVMIYAVIITFLIAFSYAFFILLSSYLFSSLYYQGHVKMLSFFHFTWMFPDASKGLAYRRLGFSNFVLIATVLILSFFRDFSDILFFTFNLVFVFVFLHFVTVAKKYVWRPVEKAALATCILLLLAGIGWPESYALKIIIQLFLCAGYLRLQCFFEVKNEKAESQKPGKTSVRRPYNFFMTSVIALHYIFIPSLIFVSIIYSEKDRADSFIDVGLKQQLKTIPADIKADSVLNLIALRADKDVYYEAMENTGFEAFLKSITFYDLPSRYYVRSLSNSPRMEGRELFADQYFKQLSKEYKVPAETFKALKKDERNRNRLTFEKSSIAGVTFSHRIKNAYIKWKMQIFTLLTLVILLLVVLYIVLSNFIQRFFFFDLRLAAASLWQGASDANQVRQQPLKPVLSPPYANITEQNIYDAENIPAVLNPSIAGIFDSKQHRYYPWRIEMAVLLIKQANEDFYKQEFEKLSPLEKFVLTDLAKDNFVNYVNKDVLVTLIQKGFVVSDPGTGHIRVLSSAFRLYLMEWVAENQATFKEEKDESLKSSWSSRKLPLLIIVIAGGIFLMYANLDFNKSMLSFIGAFVGVLGLIVKFTGTLPGAGK